MGGKRSGGSELCIGTGVWGVVDVPRRETGFGRERGCEITSESAIRVPAKLVAAGAAVAPEKASIEVRSGAMGLVGLSQGWRVAVSISNPSLWAEPARCPRRRFKNQMMAARARTITTPATAIPATSPATSPSFSRAALVRQSLRHCQSPRNRNPKRKRNPNPR